MATPEEMSELAESIFSMMETKTHEQNVLFLSRILAKLDDTSLQYLRIAWAFATDLAEKPE